MSDERQIDHKRKTEALVRVMEKHEADFLGAKDPAELSRAIGALIVDAYDEGFYTALGY